MIAQPTDSQLAATHPTHDPEADDALQARRLNFIKTHRLSHSETAELPAGFDPGPEFD